MRKEGLFLLAALLSAVLLIGALVSSANETNQSTTQSTITEVSSIPTPGEDSKVDKAYTCLENKVKNNSQLSLNEAFFSALALGSQTNSNKKIDSEKGSNCWPKSGCKLKETALGLLSYSRMGKNTEDIERWLISKNGTAAELTWYLQIDISNHVTSDCTVKSIDRNSKTQTSTIKVNDDMTLSGSIGSCLSRSSNGYWLRISQNCLDNEFEVSCNQDFVTNLLYQKSTGETIFVSSETHSASSLGTTKEKVDAKCFKLGSSCDYEGSLWAAYALSKSGNDIKSFVPYLLALSDENTKYFPHSFLFILTGSEDQHSLIIESQKQGKYWEMTNTPNNRFYDTSLAMLALSDTSDAELTNAKNYLLSIQTANGCWNNDNIRDTAFILYSGWSRAVVGAGEVKGSDTLCTAASSQYSCVRASQCIEAGGNTLYNFECPNANEFCCSVRAEEKTCAEKKGLVCGPSQRCSGTVETSADGSCCVSGACQELPAENTCESVYSGQCKSSCSDSEDEISTSCGTSQGQLCCVAKEDPSGSYIWVWVMLLLILIVLVVMGILYRDKLRMWWYKMSGKYKSSTITRPTPPSSGAGMMNPARPRPVMGMPMSGMGMRRATPASRPAPANEDDDTFKKLREMSK